jgi:NADPH:quinone reductase-like Zn-dependent oxidoreductase
MKAIVVDEASPHALRFADVPEPVARPGQAVIKVAHFSLNPGELHWAAKTGGRHEEFGFAAGTIVGHDASGVVVEASPDGRGPAVGTRVVSLGFCGSWAEKYAADLDMLAVVPDSVSLADAAALPMAGGTALGSLQLAGTAIGRRLMVTGAGGGVGRMSVQLAALAGAHVIASVSSAAKANGLEELGANEIVVGVDGITAIKQPIDIVLDALGGAYMVAAWERLSATGTMISYGWATREPAMFPPFSLVGHHGRKIVSYSSATSNGKTIETLLELVATRRLRVNIGKRGSWKAIHEAIDALWGRRVSGKIVLDVD